MKKVRNAHDYCYVETPNKDNKMLKYNHGKKSLKVSGIIYVNLKCLLEKMLSCQKCSHEKSYTVKKTKHTPSRYSLFANCSFDSTKNKLDCYKVKIVWKGFAKT